jgi:ankyrin repeat protein
MVKYLTKECNIDIDAQYKYGWTALHYSIKRCSNIDFVKYVINDCNTNIDIHAHDGATALHYAIIYSNFNILKY